MSESAVHICVAKPLGERVVYEICRSKRYKCAGQPKRRMKLTSYEWYGPSLECLTCGKVWHLD